MGLFKAGLGRHLSAVFRVWWLPSIIIVIAVVIELAGDSGRLWLRYDRAAIEAGQLWRLLSGHLAHLNWSHLVLNLAGMLLVFYLVAARFTTLQWLAISLLSVAGIDFGFWVFEPQLEWYVGLSGMLHGMLTAGLVAGLRVRSLEALILTVMFAGKLIYEQVAGPVPGTASASGGDVVVAAHFYGALTAGVIGAILPVRRQEAPI